MDPDQTVPTDILPDKSAIPSDLGLHRLSKWICMTKVDDLCWIGALTVNKCNG